MTIWCEWCFLWCSQAMGCNSYSALFHLVTSSHSLPSLLVQLSLLRFAEHRGLTQFEWRHAVLFRSKQCQAVPEAHGLWNDCEWFHIFGVSNQVWFALFTRQWRSFSLHSLNLNLTFNIYSKSHSLKAKRRNSFPTVMSAHFNMTFMCFYILILKATAAVLVFAAHPCPHPSIYTHILNTHSERLLLKKKMQPEVLIWCTRSWHSSLTLPLLEASPQLCVIVRLHCVISNKQSRRTQLVLQWATSWLRFVFYSVDICDRKQRRFRFQTRQNQNQTRIQKFVFLFLLRTVFTEWQDTEWIIDTNTMPP